MDEQKEKCFQALCELQRVTSFFAGVLMAAVKFSEMSREWQDLYLEASRQHDEATKAFLESGGMIRDL